MNPLFWSALPLFTPLVARQVQLEPSSVKLERRDGVELWTVRANQSSPALLLRRVAELSEREIEATTALERAPLVTVSLDRRPLEQVLEYALGAAGLRAEVSSDAIFVRDDQADEDTNDERLGSAAAAWQRALARFPGHPMDAGARLAQGEIDELRGHREAARSRYLDVLTLEPASRQAPEAYLRAGRIAAERGDWSEASEHYRALANLQGAEPYRAVARLELARATLRLGDAQSALHILEALDQTHPCWDETDAAARALLRGEALLAAGRFEDALAELETSAARADALAAQEVPRLRARALEGAGLLEEAARAWLLVARDESGPARWLAYRDAARLHLAAHDDLGILFVAREARAAGFGAAVTAEELAARQRLGLELEPNASGVLALEERLVRAERLLERGELDQAAPEIEALYADRALFALDGAMHARIVLGWTRCLAVSGDIEAAARLASAERAHVADEAFRKALDVGLARLFEALGMFERAADAYQGSY